ncbi:MAG: type IX secretion system protein PorD [Bacteroidia bacterium]
MKLNKIYFSIKSIVLVLFLLAGMKTIHAQEFNCNVTVNSPTIQMSNKQIFTSLEKSIEEFINSRRWTNDNYSANEKIECNIVIHVTGVAGTNYSGTIQIQSSRPCYGTNYMSPVLNILDKSFDFGYIEFQPLEYQEGVFVNELTSVLSYYAYMMLGYDYDTFSELGGTSYFQKAQTIVNSAQSSTSNGWSATAKDNKTRYSQVNEMLDERNKDFRKAMYIYHRQGMDIMASDIEKGLEHALDGLTKIQAVNKNLPNQFIVRLFFDAKSRELADLFSQAGATQKYQAKTMLVSMDVTNQALYNDKLK